MFLGIPGIRQDTMVFHLAAVAPFRLDLTAWTLRRRPRNLIDRWDGGAYQRTLATGDGAIEVVVRQIAAGSNPARVRVTVTGVPVPGLRRTVTAMLDRALGLQVDLRPFYRVAARDPKLAALVRAFRGVKPPRFPTVFESLVNAIACQQLSLTVGLELLDRLAAACAATRADRATTAFPRAQDIVRLPAESLRSLGFSGQKTRALLELSDRVMTGEVDLEQLSRLDNQAAIEQLLTLRGIGRWSAEYVLLRGLGRLDVFPGDDVGARGKLGAWLGRRRPLDYEGVQRAVDAWQPYAGMVYFHMLLAGLAEAPDAPLGMALATGRVH